MKHQILILLFAILKNSSQQILINPAVGYPPCVGDKDIYVNYEPGLPPDEENTYDLRISKNFPLHTNVVLTFDTDASIVLVSIIIIFIFLEPETTHVILSNSKSQ